MTGAFDPLDMNNIAESIVTQMLRQSPVPLGELPRFPGAGIYAIYYVGDLPAYAPITAANCDDSWSQPIYVGKAVPKGSRTGAAVVGARTSALRARLGEHSESIKAAPGLRVGDFFCRWLVVEPLWIPLGESLLINRHMPLWNTEVDGFGNHDPGAGRHKGKVSRWDVLHGGRGWVERLQPRGETIPQIEQDIAEYLRQRLDP